VQDATPTTFLFTDIEGSTRLWEQEPERMRAALAVHDAVARAAVESNRGIVVKMTGDGVHAAFADPVDAMLATVQLQQSLAGAGSPDGLALSVRCGMHLGVNEARDNDFFGTTVNRAARIMSAAHGGQVLASRAVVECIGDRMPDRFAWRDLGSVRLRDLAEAERLYQLQHPALRDTFPALRSLESTPNNLPRQLTSFVGRERELAQARELLGRTRLLTLTGVGGLGKTRLSVQLAADVLDAWPDGAWFVELAALQSPELVPQALASVLGVKEAPGQPVTVALARFVQDRRLLIVLDNCEHLLEPCAQLAKALLAAGPSIAIVASSREPLHVAGETTFALPALATPSAGADASVAAIGEYEAVRLFAERAAAARPAFRMTDANARVVADVCRQLDGIPLAIELAAARLRALSLDDIAKRLVDRFALLRSRDTTVLPRQQTLRALVDWSYDLLADDERAVFRALCVFAGGWTLEAAEAVAEVRSLDGMESASVVDLLSRLAEKSLVVHDGEGRYRLLDTLRQYGCERLEEAGEDRAAQARHLAYYLALAERARPELFGPEQGAWLARLDVERENLLAAHAAADHVPDGAALGLRLVSAVRYYWINRGLLRLGRRVTVEALARPAAQARTLARCRGLFDAGQLDVCLGHHAEGRRWLEEMLELARELGDEAQVGLALYQLCIATLGEGDLATARRYADEALAIARRRGDQGPLAAALNAVAQLHRLAGELDLAEPLYAQFQAIAEAQGDRESMAIGLLNRTMVAVARGDAARARPMLRDVLAIIRETGSRQIAQSLLEVAAGVAALRSDWTRVGAWFGAAQAQMRQTGLQRDAADEAALAPHVENARRALGAAAFAAAERAGEQRSVDAAIDDVDAWLAAEA
jgi:predicted ATPase/class 3 adenylate cyclase